MGWSLTNYDSLSLLYKDIKGDTYLIRKSLTTFKILWEQANFVEMFVKSDIFAWPQGTAPTYSTIDRVHQWVPLAISYPWTQSLHYYDADDPITNSAVDLLPILEQLTRSSDQKVEKNGVFVGERQSLNFIEGSNIVITATDDAVNDRVDVNLAVSPTFADDQFPKILMLMGG